MLSLNDDILSQLEYVSKKAKTSQSSIVSTALTIYFLMFNYAPKQANQLNEMIPEGQLEWKEIAKALKDTRNS